jgi:phenylacetate-coenzyme A ligase PaaK-like adenylate-forming protein
VLYLAPEDLEGPHIADILHEFHPTILHGPPSLILKTIQKLGSSVTHAFKSLGHIFFSGELLTRAQFSLIVEQLPSADLIHAYTVTEIGLSGTGCPTLTKKALGEDLTCSKVHPVSSYLYTILKPDDDGIGEIMLSKEGVGNYATGDMGKLEDELCPCGEARTLTIYGRYDFDLVHCAGATIHSSFLEDIFSDLSEYVRDFYAEVREIQTNIDTMGELTIYIVSTEKLRGMKKPEEFIKDHIARKLQVTKTRTLEDVVRDGIFYPPVIRIVDELPVMNKKIYLKKVYD